MIQLDCAMQTYAWGKNGSESTVANLKRSADEKFTIKEEETYAELWMGTHPSGPSKLAKLAKNNDSGPPAILLSDWLKDKPNFVGTVPHGYPSNDLPFLFKVLSVKTALSIQAHPDKDFAAALHKKYPTVYKDPNHKPEMAIALTNFECLCGFRSVSEIKQHLQEYPELKVLTASSNFEADENLKNFFTEFMSCSDSIASTQLSALITRLEGEISARPPLSSASSSSLHLKKLLLRLHSQYPGDRGVFCPLILNYLQLSKGESFFIGANEPHAYISGDCIECMALSDNVVRAGLTPKFKDVDTLCGMLNYNSGKPSILIPSKLDANTLLYRPPSDSCAEFEVEVITVPAYCTSYSPPAVACGCLLLVMSAKGLRISSSIEPVPNSISAGAVLFIVANESISIQTGEAPAVLYRAHVNLGPSP